MNEKRMKKWLGGLGL